MLEIFSENPWLIAVAEVALVSLVCVCVGIVCISCNVCRRKICLGRFDFELKRDMLQRGLSAEEIRTVIEAGRESRQGTFKTVQVEQFAAPYEPREPGRPSNTVRTA